MDSCDREVSHPLLKDTGRELTGPERLDIDNLISIEAALGIHPGDIEDWVEDYRDHTNPGITQETGYLNLESYLEDNHLGPEVREYLSKFGLETDLELAAASESSVALNTGQTINGFRGIDLEFRDIDPERELKENLDTVTFRYDGDREWPLENLYLGTPRPHGKNNNIDKEGDWKAVYSMD